MEISLALESPLALLDLRNGVLTEVSLALDSPLALVDLRKGVLIEVSLALDSVLDLVLLDGVSGTSSVPRVSSIDPVPVLVLDFLVLVGVSCDDAESVLFLGLVARDDCFCGDCPFSLLSAASTFISTSTSASSSSGTGGSADITFFLLALLFFVVVVVFSSFETLSFVLSSELSTASSTEESSFSF